MKRTYVHQAEAWHNFFALLSPASRERAGCAPGVHEELVHVFEALELVGAAPAEDVHVKLISLGEEQVRFAANEREAFQEAHADVAVGHHLGDGEGGRLDIEAALDDLEVGRYCP